MSEHVFELLPAYSAGSLEPSAAAEVSAHLAACPSCQHELSEWQAVAVAAQHATGAATPSRGLLDRVYERIEASERAPQVRPWWLPGWLQQPLARRAFAGSGAVVAIVLLLALTPVGSYAQRVLDVFQPQQFVAVPITLADMEALETLSRYGEFTHEGEGDVQDVNGAAEAESATGIALRSPGWLPESVTESPAYSVTPQFAISFTFSAEKAEEAAEEAGQELPPLADNIDGSSVEISLGMGVIALYGGTQSSEHDGAGTDDGAVRPSQVSDAVPQLMVAQAYPPTATSTGASPTELQDYILSLPGISDELANAVRAIGDPTESWPVPVPLGEMDTRAVTVQGVPGTVFTEKSGFGAAVIWLKDGYLFVVGGPLTESEALAVANSLQ